MDPVTSALIAGIAAGATKLGEQVIVEAYNKLKELLKAKFGARSKVMKALKDVEQNPESSGRKEVLKEEVAAVRAPEDKELVQFANELVRLLGSRQETTQITQTVTGNKNVQVAGDSNKISIGSHDDLDD